MDVDTVARVTRRAFDVGVQVTLPLDDVQELVRAYRTAQQVRREGILALLGNDRALLKELLEQLPKGDRS